MKKMRRIAALLLAATMLFSLLVGCASTPNQSSAESNNDSSAVQPNEPVNSYPDALAIAEQGMFSAGGTVLTSDGVFDVSNYYTSREGSTSHVDHANVFYQIPAEETGLPMVFLHGYGQSRMGWMTTPDGRPGWSDMFLRMGHSVFLIDQPRRGEAGQTSVAGTISTEPSDQTWYTQFRIGTYRNNAFTYNEGSQFPTGEEVLDQFFRQMTPDTAMDNAGGDQNIDTTVVAQAVAATINEVYERTGKDSILVTHSQGGRPGWETAQYTDHIAAIVAIEPGAAPPVDSEEYTALLNKNIPITFYYGDYIGEEFTDVPAAGMWAMMAVSADSFTEAYTAAGGNSVIVHLPDEGIAGNDHFMFQDLNNDVIAEHVENWIQNNVGVSNSAASQSPAAPENKNGKTLVVYYSSTGNTEAVAKYIANATGGDTFAITPAEPYSSNDLNWSDSDSRVSREHDDPALRTMELTETTVDGWENYDTVFIGYPIWWGVAAWPVDNFISANDFTDKTVIPFCTSASSDIGESGELLAELAGNGDWLEGRRFRSGVDEADVVEWVNGLNIQ